MVFLGILVWLFAFASGARENTGRNSTPYSLEVIGFLYFIPISVQVKNKTITPLARIYRYVYDKCIDIVCRGKPQQKKRRKIAARKDIQ